MTTMQQEQSLVPCVDTTAKQQQNESLVPHQQPQDQQEEDKDIPLYQKAFKVDFIGRRKKKSKQQVTWTFVYGASEHTVMLTWSTQTGKVLIHLDGKEIHVSDLKGFSIIQRKVQCRELGVHLEILASRTAPNHAKEDFLCHECIINGQAFSGLPSLYENRLLIETNDGTGGRPVYVEEGDTFSSSNGESDSYSAGYMEDLRSVVDIVYPNGIPPFKP